MSTTEYFLDRHGKKNFTQTGYNAVSGYAKNMQEDVGYLPEATSYNYLGHAGRMDCREMMGKFSSKQKCDRLGYDINEFSKSPPISGTPS